MITGNSNILKRAFMKPTYLATILALGLINSSLYGMEHAEVAAASSAAASASSSAHACSSANISDDCPICLMRLSPKSVAYACHFFGAPQTPCHISHRLHEKCLNLWLHTCEVNGHLATCPMCRAPLLTEQDRQLLTAAQEGNVALVHAALDAGAHIHINRDEAFRVALQYARFNVVHELLFNQGMHIDWTLFLPDLIHAASQKNATDVIKDIISQYPADINLADMDGTMCRLAHAGNLPLIQLFMPLGKKSHKGFVKALRMAALHNHLGVVRYFIEERRITDEIEPITSGAIELGNVDIAQYLLEKFPSKTTTQNLLFLAIKKGQLALVQQLSTRDGLKKYLPEAFSFALQHDHVAIIRYFIEDRHFTVDLQKILFWAITNNHAPLLEYLIAQLNHTTRPITHPTLRARLENAFCTAFERKHLDPINYLMHNHLVNPQAIVTRAAQTGNLPLVSYLLEEQTVQTPLTELAYTAIEHAHPEIATYLITKHRIRPDLMLLNAIQTTQRAPLRYLLTAQHDSIDLTSALYYAAEHGDLDTITLIAQNHHFTSYQFTQALLLAIHNHHDALVTALISRTNGITQEVLQETLHAAIKEHHTELARTLIRRLGIMDLAHEKLLHEVIDAADVEVFRVLFELLRGHTTAPTCLQELAEHATCAGQLDILRYLLDAQRVKVNITALLQWARRRNQQEIIAYLVTTHDTALDMEIITPWADGRDYHDIMRDAHASASGASSSASDAHPAT